MICPCCEKEIDLPLYAWHNVDAYRKPVTVVSLCCGKPVRLRAITTFAASKYEGNEKVDDWGTKING